MPPILVVFREKLCFRARTPRGNSAATSRISPNLPFLQGFHRMTLPRISKKLLGASLAALFCMHSALAFAGDEVLLKDGTVLRGTVVKQMPGKVVVIKTTTGTTESIPWDDVKRVSLGEEPTPVSSKPAASSSSAPPTQAAEPKVQEPAAPPFPSYFDVGMRAGFALPMGGFAQSEGLVSQTLEMSDLFKGKIPIWVEGNWHFSEHLSVGAVFDIGPVLTSSEPKGACAKRELSSGYKVIRNAVNDCSALSYRVGVQLLYYPSPDANWSPFLGVGIGYEWLHASRNDSLSYKSSDGSASSYSGTASSTYKGVELLQIQAGLMKNMGALSVGPFVGLSLGMYLYNSGTATGTSGGVTMSREVDTTLSDPTVHEWLTFGVRGTYKIGP